jgi:predicted 3-demethylubiquinone-9 3-methyltransferase (glyoxalase superfamily)
VQCDSQEEIDYYWEKLTADGGEPGPCGWLKDKFGVSWQVNPRDIGKFWGNGTDPGQAKRAMEARMKMSKIDIAALERAAKA